MAEYTIDKIEYGGNIYKLQDNESGFVTTEVFYGTCATGAATAAKVVSCANFTSSDLKAGVIIVVNFSATNSAAVGDLTLNVNSTGAKKIQYINNGTRGNLSSANYLKASTSYPFIYDGTYWLAQINYNSNTTYSAGTAELIETGTDTGNRVWQAKILHDYIASVNNLFIAEYGVTTFTDALTALNNGKVLVCKVSDTDEYGSDQLLPLTYFDAEGDVLSFSTIDLSGGKAYGGTVFVAYLRQTSPTWTLVNRTFASLESPIFTGTPKAPTATAGTNTTQIATTAFVKTAVDNGTISKTTTTPKMNGTAAIGSETKYAAGDHVHPSDTTKADKSATVSTVAWDSTNKKLTKTINGTTSDVVTAATLRTGLNVADGAEVNQNAFSNVKVGSTTIAADSKTDTLELVAGTGVTLTPDATNDKVTISATSSGGGLVNLQDGTGTGSIEMSNASAVKSYQTALGKYNKEDTGTDKDLSNFAFIIGDGSSSSARSNLFTINNSGLVTTHPFSSDYNWKTSSAAPNETQYFTGFEIRDRDEVRLGHLDTHIDTTGKVGTVLGAERKVGNDIIRNQIYLYVGASGSKSYLIDDPAAFRSALGIEDYITDQGTTGIWTYRKWGSGVSECWALTSSANYAVTNQYVNGYYANLGTVSLPSSLFIAAPTIQATRTNTGSGSALIFLSLHTVTASSFAGFVCATSSGTYACQFSYYAKGRWKS